MSAMQDMSPEQRRKQIAATYGHGDYQEIQKSWTESQDLEKGGEGSKGGRVIGHTSSGKPIYQHFSHSQHSNFTAKDHKDAAKLKGKIAEKVSNDESKKKVFDHYSDDSNKHYDKFQTMTKDPYKDVPADLEDNEGPDDDWEDGDEGAKGYKKQVQKK